MGLLPVIRMSEPDVTTLSLGIDLQTLGLNLNAADSLHRTFGSPWSDQGRPGALATKLPACYLFPPQHLDASCLQRFTNLSVFFVFYAFAGAPLLPVLCPVVLRVVYSTLRNSGYEHLCVLGLRGRRCAAGALLLPVICPVVLRMTLLRTLLRPSPFCSSSFSAFSGALLLLVRCPLVFVSVTCV